MNIAVGLSGNYLKHLIVMVTSLCENNNNEIKLYALVEEFSDQDKNEFYESVSKYKNLETFFIDITEDDVKGFPITQYFRVSTFFRVLLATKLPKEVEKILYLDIDLIVDGSLEELWNIEVNETYPIAAVQEKSVTNYCERLNVPANYYYVNAGVLLLNIKEVRKQHLFEKLIKYIHENKEKLLWLDQDALNASLYDKIKYIDCKWNYHNYFIIERAKNREIILQFDNPVIVHYTGSIKPWADSSYSTLGYLYHNYENVAMENKKEFIDDVTEEIYNNSDKVSIKSKLKSVAFKFLKLILKKIYTSIKTQKLYNIYDKYSYRFIGIHCKIIAHRNRDVITDEVANLFFGKEVKDVEYSKIKKQFTYDIYRIEQSSKYIGFEGYAFYKNNQTQNCYIYAKNIKTGDIKLFSTTETILQFLKYTDDDGVEYDQCTSAFKVYIEKSQFDYYEYEFGIVLETNSDLMYSGEIKSFYIAENYKKETSVNSKVNASIYTMHFGKYFTFEDDIYKPMQLGKKLAKVKLDMIGDDTGDNISDQNDLYCELTGMYWAWKNDLDSDYIGLAHYRRFLVPKILNEKIPLEKILKFNSQKMEELLNYYDVILPKVAIMKCSVRDQYRKEHNVNDYDVMINVINEKYPFLSKCAEQASNSNGIYLANLFVMKREIFNQYCDVMFGTLDEVAKRIEISNDSYDKRVLGFLAERITTIFAYYLYNEKHCNIAEVGLLNTDALISHLSSRFYNSQLEISEKPRNYNSVIVDANVHNGSLFLNVMSHLIGTKLVMQKCYIKLYNVENEITYHLEELVDYNTAIYKDLFPYFNNEEIYIGNVMINPNVKIKDGNYAIKTIVRDLETNECFENKITNRYIEVTNNEIVLKITH